MIGTTLKNLLDDQGVNVNELSRRIGVSAQTLYSIIKRDNMKIDFDILLKICDALHIPVDVFYGDRYMNSPDLDPPNGDEWALLKNYRHLDEHGQEMVNVVMYGELERLERRAAEVRSNPDTRVIPLFSTLAAAGYASPALGEDYEEYIVAADSPADFAVRISGDSMEPYIADGSIVLVTRQASLGSGDVGLFFVNGDMKCKQYCEDISGNIFLLSFNRAGNDADIAVMASSGIPVCCFGKVVLTSRPPLPKE